MPEHVLLLLFYLATTFSLIYTYTPDRDCDVTFSSTDVKENNFTSPGWPNQYPVNKRCIYRFVGLSDERVDIRFNKFNIQGMTRECRYDYLDVYIQLSDSDDQLMNAPMLGRFCGNNLKEDVPNHIVSTSNVIVMIFFSDAAKTGGGFHGTVKFINSSIYNIGEKTGSSGCSYTINSKNRRTGYIVSPTFPGTYPDNLNCKYHFFGTPNERIKLTFNNFSIFHGGDYCPFDYLLIKDGREETNAEDIGVFCGKYENVSIFSSREYMFIEFITRSGRVSFDANSLDNNADYKFDRLGFNISYEFSTEYIRFDLKDTPDALHVIGTECDIRISSQGQSDGRFKSPGFKHRFPKNTTCRVYLDGEMNPDRLEKVFVNFTDFNITGNMSRCPNGFLGVTYQGHRQFNTIDEKFCGSLWPPKLISSDARMILTFDTHRATTAHFHAYYKFIEDFGIPEGSQRRDGCNFIYESSFEKSEGTFNSPRHPDNYPPSIACNYTFQPNEQKSESVLIFFTVFAMGDTRSDDECLRSDYLELYENEGLDYYAENFRPTKRFCSSKIPAPIMAHKKIRLRFVANTNSQNQGFKAVFQFLSKEKIQQSCGDVIRSDGKGGVIKSPRFPMKYERQTFCEWTIFASKAQNRILLQLQTLKIEGEMLVDNADDASYQGCRHAVLRINDGKTVSEVCGLLDEKKLKRELVLSYDDSVTIQFVTSSKAVGANGFQLIWTEIHTTEPCYGFVCESTKYCISSELKCNQLPNCGSDDESDEKCARAAKAGAGPREEKVQVVHIVIGTSVSVFFCVVLLVCGVYHRKKLRGTNSPEDDHVEVRYVAAASGSNTTDRLLTLDKSDASRSPERTESEQDQVQSVPVKANMAGHNTEENAHPHAHTPAHAPTENNTSQHNHSNNSQEPGPPPPPPPVVPENHSRTLPSGTKIQKVSIV